MQRASWWALGLLAGGLVGCGVESHQPSSRFEGKLEARERMTAPDFVPTPGEDVCADNDWYADGECDFWCPQPDSDCDGGAVCAAFIEDSDGICRRESSDPCRSQDPDCDVACPEPVPPPADSVCEVDPMDPCVAFNDRDCQGVACAEYIEMPDGVCSRGEDDKCRFQDPDCDDDGPVICTAISEFPDGVCDPEPGDPCAMVHDPDCGVVCPAIDLPVPAPDGICNDDGDPCTPADPDCYCAGFLPGDMGARPAPPIDGVCEMLPCGGYDPDCETCAADIYYPQPERDGECVEDNDPCTPVDPDCVACAEYVEPSDGMCSRDPNDPCIFQDPDCNAQCLIAPEPQPSDGVCEQDMDPCTPADPDCYACAFFAPPPPEDGVCNGDPNDPCSYQYDPDCNVICTDHVEPSDGQCTRFEKDPCISQDPDCFTVDCTLVDPNPTPDMMCGFPLDASCRMADPDCAVDTDA